MTLRVLLLALMLFSGPALAQDEPVPIGLRNIDLMDDCQRDTTRIQCAAYISGMVDMHAMMSDILGRRLYCLPKTDITVRQTIRIFVEWAEEHPEQLHEGKRIGFVQALAEAFPCK
jgi:hypothetical protein